MATNNAIDNYTNNGAIIQVVSTSGAGSSTTSTSAVDITNATLTITPTSTSNKVLIYATFACDVPQLAATATSMYIQCLRNGSNINGTPFARIGTDNNASAVELKTTAGFVFVDAPSSTSALTYKFQQYSSTASITVVTSNVNIVLMEIVA